MKITNPVRLDLKYGYVRAYQDRLTESYIAVVREKDAALADLVEQLIGLLALKGKTVPDATRPEAKRRRNKAKRADAYLHFWASLPGERQLALAQEYAKISTMTQAVRVAAVTDVVQAHNDIRSTTAGSIDFVIRRFREEKVSASQLQQFLDENCTAWFSLTSHPTNPATVEYSLAEIAMSAILADPNADGEALLHSLRAIRDCDIVGPHKAPIDEARETLGTLQVLYRIAPRNKALFDTALERYGYAAEGVTIRQPLIRPRFWNDGDGNDNMTAKVLADDIALHRTAIRDLYMASLTEIDEAIAGRETAQRKLAAIKSAIQGVAEEENKIPDLQGMLMQVEDLKADIEDAPTRQLVADFAYRLSCFNFCFGMFDLRHNAVDLMTTVARVVDAADIMAEDEFDALTDLEKESAIAGWLADTQVTDRLGDLSPVSLIRGDDDMNGQTAARVFERLQIVGRNPDCCEKLIIAETVNAAHALTALFLLKITGNAVGTQQSRIDIVTLSESVAELATIGRMLETLLENDGYRQHVVARRRLIAMVAKSDTTRQDGRGEAEYAQYEAAVAIYGVIDRMKNKFIDLEYVQTCIMNGGGHALQRGGGRIAEIPALHGRAAADARASDIGPSTLTIQGHQQRILLAPDKTAIGTLEALASHNLYTKAGIFGEMPPPENFRGMNRQYARVDAWLYAKAAGAAFERLTKQNPAIDTLLENAPWLSMKAGNVSSRPAKRGEKQVGPGITPREAKGDKPKALQGRAISGERLTAHACLPVFTLLGLVEAMDIVHSESQTRLNPDKYGEPLHHLYRSHKIHRDGARVNINAAPIADFDIAWPMLVGRERPTGEEVEELAGHFRPEADSGENEPEVTLAYLESYFLKTEKLTFEMVTGEEAGADFRHGDGLRILWPELAEQVEHRNRFAEFARVVEAYRNEGFNAKPDEAISELEYRITQAIYTAADVIDAPTGILATRTRLEPVRRLSTGRIVFSRPLSYTEKPVRDRLSLPPSLVDLGKHLRN